jgi:Transposase and inactivated derivatives, IS5 family
MKQMTFGTATGFEKHSKVTRRAQFLAEMNAVMPWSRFLGMIEPFYPKSGNGRRPRGLEIMLRIYFLQHWFNLSDPGVEEALYDSQSMRSFVGIDLGREPAPDETTILNFRHLLEKHRLGDQLFGEINAYLAERGLKVAGGTIVDATIIAAPSSTKNEKQERDPEMHQTKKGNQWYFGMKGHIGVDSKTGLIHSAAVTPANTHDSQAIEHLLHGNETRVWGDSAYSGQTEKIKSKAPKALDFTNEKGRRHAPLTESQKATNRTKSKVRSIVEHPFLTIKQLFKFSKVCYKGLQKNAHRFFVACGLANLHRARYFLMRQDRRGAFAAA